VGLGAAEGTRVSANPGQCESGTVIEGTAEWEYGRVDGAQVLVHDQAESSIELLQIWYGGGSPGNQGIGVATRSAPAPLW